MNPFIATITSTDLAQRNRSFAELAAPWDAAALLDACEELERFRRDASNLYERVRATMFLYAAHRFRLALSDGFPATGPVPYAGFSDMLERRFEEALRRFRAALRSQGPSGSLCSALAACYHHLAFQTLTDQVRASVRASVGNRWMFRVGAADEHPLRLRPELMARVGHAALYPILHEATAVRLDLSHSGWSDIFFLGMDYPEGARVLNISVDLGVYGRDTKVRPPIHTYLRVIAEPVLRLTSLDLHATKDVHDLRELFNFGNDYLGLLKAGVVASGLVPPSFEGTGQDLGAILARVVGPGAGIELVTHVNDIPKGSRLAVSTNLLASIVSALMRATGQTKALAGPLTEAERRQVASRAILGEWLGGSGGGWQDSGGVWPGMKIIEGAEAGPGDPENGISRGRLLPRHRVLTGEGEVHPDAARCLAESLILIHGGMAQNVGPILEMVTEKYLLRSQPEWDARQRFPAIFDGIRQGLRDGDFQAVGTATQRNWDGPLKTIIPWVSTRFTERIIAETRSRLGADFWGFLMLGGMSGGGMGLFVAPHRRAAYRDEVLAVMRQAKADLEDALPFAMDPLVYDFGINPRGTWADLEEGDAAIMPHGYFAVQIPELVRTPAASIAYARRAEIDAFTARDTEPEAVRGLLRPLVRSLFQVSSAASASQGAQWDTETARIKAENGFDPVQHEQLRADLRAGRLGLARNRLPVDTDIADVSDDDVAALDPMGPARRRGEAAIAEGRVAVMTLAAGVGSRWTQGAGVIKAINPFVMMEGRHRSFLELHLGKTRLTAESYGTPIPHLIATSFLTHGPLERHLRASRNYGYPGPVHLSTGRSIGQRFVPMVRDLEFLWEEMPQETLDEQKQKMRESVRRALMDWARHLGEGSDYTANLPLQRLHPTGHWFEVPNLFRNGLLAQLLEAQPQLETIMVHNVDTLGADLDPAALGMHLESGRALTFEVIPRHIEDRGGGLARVNGRVRLLEGLAQPREEDEFKLRYYNSMTTWVQIDPLLELFGLARSDLRGPQEPIAAAVRRMAQRVPSYITIKDVKWRWGHGQEDVYPVAQFEKLWSDMTALPEAPCGYLVVPRLRGQQLKDPAELDPWANDGSRDYVASRCRLEPEPGPG